MPYKADPIAEKLDKVASTVGNVTGLSRLQRRFNSGRAFRFRFIPVALLALSVTTLWAQIAWTELAGFMIMMAIWMTSGAIQSFSPLGNLRGGKLDERETALVRSGHSAGLLAAMGVAVLGCLLLGMGNIANQIHMGNFWAPTSGTDWFTLAFFILAIEANVATLAGSMKLPPDLGDEDE